MKRAGTIDLESPSRPDVRNSRRLRFVVCLAVFIVLGVWLLIWPYTGDGDAALHYRNLRESAINPAEALTPWARPVYVALMLMPASGGIFAVRLFTAMLSTLLVWQTMRMADDLELPNPTMAGPMVIWQPFAFALAADTMTEMPMALGIVLAIRLWWARRPALALLLVSFLPMVRPEGFFIAGLFGVLSLLPDASGLSWRRRLANALLLGTGIIVWILACTLIVHEPFYFIRSWPWPPRNYACYGRGTLLHFVRNWPAYCGPILFPFFILGVLPSIRKKMMLPLGIWAMVFLLHTILWWRGWFASVGLLRILACTSPLTALICLHGLNLIAQSKIWKGLPGALQVVAQTGFVLLATATPLLNYVADAQAHHYKLIAQAVAYARANDLPTRAPAIFVSDELVLAVLGYPAYRDKWRPNMWNSRDEQLKMLAALPSGSVGIWDNQRGEQWFGVRVEDLPKIGYEVVFDTHQTLSPFSILGIWQREWSTYQRCVVVRKP